MGWLIFAANVLLWLWVTRMIQSRWDEKYVNYEHKSYPHDDLIGDSPAARLAMSFLIALIWPIAIIGLFFLKTPTKSVRSAAQAKADAKELEYLRAVALREGLPMPKGE